MMTKEELAAKLNGREYLHEMTKEEEREARASGLVVIFGASYDIMELRGAVTDQFDYCGVTALWDMEGYSWVYETNMSHASFDIMDGEDKYCRGIVVELPKP